MPTRTMQHSQHREELILQVMRSREVLPRRLLPHPPRDGVAGAVPTARNRQQDVVDGAILAAP